MTPVGMDAHPAERKAGEMLAAKEKNKGAATRMHDESALNGDSIPTYADMAAQDACGVMVGGRGIRVCNNNARRGATSRPPAGANTTAAPNP